MGCKEKEIEKRIRKNKSAGWREIEERKKQAKMAKLKFEIKRRVGEGSSKMCYLKYRISDALAITLNKNNATTTTLPTTN